LWALRWSVTVQRITFNNQRMRSGRDGNTGNAFLAASTTPNTRIAAAFL
jgi:hypothetical protein